MTRIATDQDVVTVVNVFTVEPERQQHLIDLLVETTRTIREQPGFVSANIHRSLDGTKVVNYAQWRRAEDFQAMLRDSAAQVHMRAADEVATSIEPHLYQVVFTDEIGSERP
jgi:heme-degrading monooxygenase HmoA